MQIPEEFRECVVFICAGKSPEPIGTGFLLGCQRAGLLYVVTASHVIDNRPGQPLSVRINLEQGGYEDVPAARQRWRVHPTSDLAAIPLEWADRFRGVAIDEHHLATPQDILAYRVAIGDEVFMPGLFTGTPGCERVVATVRFGHISLMPGETISLREWQSDRGEVRLRVQAYLLECRAWEEFSGSPVFVRFDKEAVEDVVDEIGESEGRLVVIERIKYVALLGIMHGEFEPRDRTSGLSVAIPSGDLMVLLRTEEFVKDRERARKKADDGRQKPRPASVQRASLTKEEFTNALSQASRRLKRPSGPDQGEKGT